MDSMQVQTRRSKRLAGETQQAVKLQNAINQMTGSFESEMGAGDSQASTTSIQGKPSTSKTQAFCQERNSELSVPQGASNDGDEKSNASTNVGEFASEIERTSKEGELHVATKIVLNDGKVPTPSSNPSQDLWQQMQTHMQCTTKAMQNDMNDQLKSVSVNLQNQMKGVLDAIQNQMQMQLYTQAQMQTQMQELNKNMSTSDANFQQDSSLDEETPENCDSGKVKNSADDVEGKSVSRPTNSSILNRGCKLPPFTGKERWEVWRNRFEAVAKRCGWSERDMLDELLPRLQGTAAEFVYAELNDKSLSCYDLLIRELDCRFKQVELSKSYKAEFSHRNQRSGESVEEYAVELKRLYDKGFANRPSTIRQEDLLRRFLDGLSDVKASQQVEFVKEPTNIDIAVVEVKAYQETSRQSKGKGNDKRVYMVRPGDDDDGEKDVDVDSEDKGKIRMTRLPNKNSSKGKEVNHKTLGTNEANMQEQFKKIYEQLAQMQTDFKLHLNQLETKVKDSSSTNLQSWQSGGQYKQRSHTSNGRQTVQQSIVCFVCSVQGHMARNCPTKSWRTAQFGYNPGNNSMAWGNYTSSSGTVNSGLSKPNSTGMQERHLNSQSTQQNESMGSSNFANELHHNSSGVQVN